MLTYLMERSGVTQGWLLLAIVSIAVVSYALGCFNGAVMVSRGILKDDIREHGSGNGGLTNFCRIHGGILSVVVILIDMLKAVISVLVATLIVRALSPELVVMAKFWAGLWCILGHMFPCNFEFRGGKGVLSSGAIALMIDWRLALVIWGCFLICAIATKYVSLGSCVGALSCPIASYFIFHDWIVTVLAAVMGGLVIFKHRGNIMRLIKGTESKFTFKWGSKRSDDPEAPAIEPEEESEPEVIEAEDEPVADEMASQEQEFECPAEEEAK